MWGMALLDLPTLAATMTASVPFAGTIGVRYLEVGPEGADGARAVVALPDAPAVHNHVGGPHAGAMFTLGETASGAVVIVKASPARAASSAAFGCRGRDRNGRRLVRDGVEPRPSTV